MKRKIISTVIIIIMIVGAIMITKHLIATKPKPAKDIERAQILSVKVSEVNYKDIQIPVEYHGRVFSKETVAIASEVSGKILPGDIPFKTGQSFKKGQIIAKIYDEDMRASITAQKSTFLNTLSSALPDIHIDYPQEYDKWFNFFEAIDLTGTMPELPDFNSSKEKIFLASRNIIAAYYNIIQLEITLSKYTIYAPFDGAYKSVGKEVGSIAGMNQEMATIIRTDEMEIIVPVLPEDIKWIKPGQETLVVVDNATSLTGKVSRIAQFVDPSNQSINVYVKVSQQKDTPIYEGQFLNVIFPGKELKQVIEVPREAVFKNNKVWIVKDDCLNLQQVNVVRNSDDMRYINGLNPGTMLVKESLINVAQGQRVNQID